MDPLCLCLSHALCNHEILVFHLLDIPQLPLSPIIPLLLSFDRPSHSLLSHLLPPTQTEPLLVPRGQGEYVHDGFQELGQKDGSKSWR